MKILLVSLFMPLISLVTACTSPKSAESPAALADSTVPAKPSKLRKSHRHALPEGVISVDIINYNNRLHLLTGQHRNGQKTLWHQFSDDQGISWSDAVSILAEDNLSANMVRGNDAQIAAQGQNIVVTWMKYVPEARFNAGPMQAARSTDGGKTWRTASTPPDWTPGPHGYIELAADKVAMHAVWLDSRQGRSSVKASQALHYARSEDGGQSWQANVTLDDLTCSCCWNSIKTDTDGNAYVLYRDKQPSDLSIGVVDRQSQWHYLNHVGAFDWQFEGCPHIGGGLDFQVKTGNKRLHAVVGSGHPEHLGVHYLFSDDNGKHWSDTRRLGDESAVHADIAAHDGGRVVAVWDMLAEKNLAVFMAESADQGARWSDAVQLSNPGMRATHPRIVKTASGFLSVWTENNGHQQTLAMRRL